MEIPELFALAGAVAFAASIWCNLKMAIQIADARGALESEKRKGNQAESNTIQLLHKNNELVRLFDERSKPCHG